MGLSLSGVEPSTVSDKLPKGTYLCKPVTPVMRKKSRKGDPQIEFDWRVQNGEWKGSEQRAWITFGDFARALNDVAAVLQACDIAIPDTEFKDYAEMRDWVADQLDKGPLAGVVVRWEPYDYVKDDGTHVQGEGPTVAGYVNPADGDLSSTFEGVHPTVNGEDQKRKDPF